MTEIIKIIIGILSAILIALVGFIYNRNRKIKAYYEVVWRKSSSLKPKEVLGMRPFDSYYYHRPEDDLIGESLDKEENVLIIGPPLSGKSRAAYQALRKLSKPHDVIVPKCTDIDRGNFLFPKHLNFWRPRIILFDDLHRLVEQRNFECLFEAARENNAIIIATCRSGMEYQKAKNKMLDKNMDLETIFANSIELKKISEDTGRKIANEVEINWDKVRFDGTIGSIFMRLIEMERRFDECTGVEKTILRAIKNLYICGVYRENQVFPLDWIRTLAKQVGLEGKDFEWSAWLENLENTELIALVKDGVQAEEVYLEYLVTPKSEMPNLDIFQQTLVTFSGVTEALFRLGTRVYAVGTTQLKKAEYMKTAIKAFEEALKFYTLERFPADYALTHNNLGAAYGTLAKVEEKAENCKKAIKALEQALEVYTLERFPVDYAMTQNNIGAAYEMLAQVEAKADNCKMAIKACEEALRVRTLEHFPMQYAMTQNNLGIAYEILAGVEEQAHNCKKAIKAFEEALRVYTMERFPIDYAMTQNNLGAARRTLAEVEAKAENCKKAITACEEALRVRTLERFPMDYAMTQNNLGAARRTLAEVEAKAENCKKAISAFEEALKVYTMERFPMDYAMTQNNLGNACATLAKVEAKAENCKEAIKAFEEALTVYILESFPMQYAITQNNLGNAYATLAKVEAKAENCKEAIKAYEKALKIYTKEEFPETHRRIAHNLRILLAFCGGA